MGSRDFFSGLFFMLLGIAFTVCAFFYRLVVDGIPGPGLFPSVMGFALILFSSILLIGHHSFKGEQDKAGRREPGFFIKGGWSKLLVVLLALCGYATVLKYLGFIPTTFLFMFFLLRAVEPQKWSTTLIVSLLTTVFCYVLFNLLLTVDMPKGILRLVGG